MAYSLRVASCFLFCASAVQDVVHIHRKAKQIPSIDIPNIKIPDINISGVDISDVQNAVDNAVGAANDVIDSATDETTKVASEVLDNAMDKLDDVVTTLDEQLKDDTIVISGSALVDNAYVDHSLDLLKILAVYGNPHNERPFIDGLQGAQLVARDMAMTFHASAASLETQLTDALQNLSAAGFDTAQKALSEVNDALQPLHLVEESLNTTWDALARSSDLKVNANTVQAPLKEAIDSAEQSLARLDDLDTAKLWISHTFNNILLDAEHIPNATISDGLLQEISNSVHKAVADSTQLVEDMKGLVKDPMAEMMPALKLTQDFTWQAAHMGATTAAPSAAEGSRFLSAAVGGVVLMALSAAVA